MTTSARGKTIAGLAATLLLTVGCGPKYLDAQTVAATSTCTNAGVLAGWSVQRLAKQTLVVPVQETSVTTVAPEVAAGIGGIILFGSSAPSNLGSTLASMEAGAPGGIKPFVMSDEEGGAVQRMANLVGTIPSARTMGATMTTDQIRSLAHRVGLRMRGAGVTMDLAPVLDLDGRAGPNSTDAIGTRSFSTDPQKAAADGLAFAGGLREASVIPVAKHFPGIGHANGNTDLGPASTSSWSTVATRDIVPYVSAIRVSIPAIMVSNATVPGLTTGPASLSAAAITDVLRGRMGFAGLVMTDSLSAGAVSRAGFPVPRAVVAALVAGADMLLYGATASTVHTLTQQAVDAVTAAVAAGTLHRIRLENAARHVLAAKHVDLCA
jgi:beta-N-acetylhexosaminidase